MIRILFFLLLIGLWSIKSLASESELQLKFIGASTVELNNPHDLKLSQDGKYLFVSDVGKNRIAVLNPNTLEFITEFGSDHQSGTHDIDFSADGRAYVADTHNNRVAIYDMDGATAQLVGELTERIRGPEGVLVHRNGRIYVAGAWSNNVVAYKNGQVVAELRGLSSPHDLEETIGGDIWLADAGNDRMLLLSSELDIKGELSGKRYNFNGVRYQDVLSDGTLIVADKNNHQVKFIGIDGRLLLVLGEKNEEKAGESLQHPRVSK
ncbi:MAG TPA: hypothetical protein EYN14_02795 [Alphaproteobacteria bacterium]|nr:hypothetical protein [Alphaproteobacteria bacterium]